MKILIDSLNGYLYGYILIYLLLFTGVYFTIRLGFSQFRHFLHMWSMLGKSRQFSGNKGDEAKGISAFQALCTTLASRVGTGTVAGVAIAIYLGGPGAVFWMWLIALLGMATAFAESTLAQLYKVVDKYGNFRGGPAYYMQTGMKSPFMGLLFSIFLIFTFGFAFNAVQSNSIGIAMQVAFNVPAHISGIILFILTAAVIFGGSRQVAKVSEWVVPIMAISYLIVAITAVLLHIKEVPAVFKLIIDSAFGIKQVGGATFGYAVNQAMMQGIRRGLFSNEAGMGSAPNAAASASSLHPAEQGYMQMLGPFIATIVICTCTAIIILLSDQLVPGSNVSGVELTQKSLSAHIGPIGTPFIAIIILFFCFTTIIGNYAYAETNMMFLNFGGRWKLIIFRLVVLAVVFIGTISAMPLVWSVADLAMGLMAITNLVAILYLSKIAITVAADYNKQLKAKVIPVFNINKYPEIKKGLDTKIWEGDKS
jgi:AGCS family alanine or glycine:cation symporter